MMKTCMTYMSVLSNDDNVKSDKYHKHMTQRITDLLAQVFVIKYLIVFFTKSFQNQMIL